MIIRLLQSAAVATVLTSAVAATAETTSQPAQKQTAYYAGQAETQFAKFAPGQSTDSRTIDYSHWDEALKFFVIRMGGSIRQSATTLDAPMGSRTQFGHDSRYRLEGNRVAFSFLEPQQIAALTAYKEDLQQTAEQIDIGALPRNEQLAFWMNLHNVTVIEQIALAYPVTQPSLIRFADGRTGIDEALAITISGVKMSPRDIRTKIVYPNWKDPKVIYGFFRGEIGGPSIQNEAFNADNIGALLNRSGGEFVNSLRGTQKRGNTLQVSKIYEEARPFYFSNWDADLKGHIAAFSGDEVKGLLGNTKSVRANIYELDISDLANGERSPIYSPLYINGGASLRQNGKTLDPNGGLPQKTRILPSISRLMTERSRKFQKMIRNKDLVGRVFFIDPDAGDGKPPEQVK